MFDFAGYIVRKGSKKLQNINFPISEDYLAPVKYSKGKAVGSRFYLEYLWRDNVSKFMCDKDGCSVFILGRVFTNEKYQHQFHHAPQEYDGAKILKLYRNLGVDFIHYLKGIFLVLVFDEREGEYLCYNSRFGLLDLYYYVSDEAIYFSTSMLTLLKTLGNAEHDGVGILQHVVFDYPLGDRTHYSKIKPVPVGHYLHIRKNLSIDNVKYHNFEDILHTGPVMNWEEAYSATPGEFNKVVELQASVNDKLSCSITGGYDSRTVLSKLSLLQKDVLYYTWGMEQSYEIQVARKVTSMLGLNYKPILLDDHFLKDYNYFALQALFRSDGRATIRRANHAYGYSILSSHSSDVLTGLFGSELLRPSNSVGHIYNRAFIDVFLSDNKEQALKRWLSRELENGLVDKEFVNTIKNEFLEETLFYFQGFDKFDQAYKKLYYFTLTEGFRKYFGHEIHGCRAYAHINAPYIDDDFVNFVLKTPVPTLDKHAFERNSKEIRLGQKFYFPILESNNEKLMKIKLSRFFSPSDVKSKFYPITVLPGFTRKLFIKKILKYNDTFRSDLWIKKLIVDEPLQNKFGILSTSDLYNTRKDFIYIAKLYSLITWLDNSM